MSSSVTVRNDKVDSPEGHEWGLCLGQSAVSKLLPEAQSMLSGILLPPGPEAELPSWVPGPFNTRLLAACLLV